MAAVRTQNTIHYPDQHAPDGSTTLRHQHDHSLQPRPQTSMWPLWYDRPWTSQPPTVIGSRPQTWSLEAAWAQMSPWHRVAVQARQICVVTASVRPSGPHLASGDGLDPGYLYGLLWYQEPWISTHTLAAVGLWITVFPITMWVFVGLISLQVFLRNLLAELPVPEGSISSTNQKGENKQLLDEASATHPLSG